LGGPLISPPLIFFGAKRVWKGLFKGKGFLSPNFKKQPPKKFFQPGKGVPFPLKKLSNKKGGFKFPQFKLLNFFLKHFFGGAFIYFPLFWGPPPKFLKAQKFSLFWGKREIYPFI